MKIEIDLGKLLEFYGMYSENYDLADGNEFRAFILDFVCYGDKEESCGYGYDISTTDEPRQFLYDCKTSKEPKIEPKRKFKVLDILGSKGLICEAPGVLEGYCGRHECYIYYLTYDKDGAKKDGEVYPFTLHDGSSYPPEGTYFTIMMDRKLSFPAESKAFRLNDRFIGYHMEVQKQTVDEFFGD